MPSYCWWPPAKSEMPTRTCTGLPSESSISGRPCLARHRTGIRAHQRDAGCLFVPTWRLPVYAALRDPPTARQPRRGRTDTLTQIASQQALWRSAHIHHIWPVSALPDLDHQSAQIGGSVRVLPGPRIIECNAAYRGSPLRLSTVRLLWGLPSTRSARGAARAWAARFRSCGGSGQRGPARPRRAG
jgi:hypothetical protein